MSQYTVKSGDTLSAIAKKYGVGIDSISGYKSGNANLIYPNEVLNIDNPVQSTPTNTPPQFQDTTQVQTYLNTRQNELYSKANDPSAPPLEDIMNIDKITNQIKGLLPTGNAPTAPNMLNTFNTLRADQGVQGLEKQANDIKGQIDDLNAQYNLNKVTEKGKPVAQNVIEGRISEQTQQYQTGLEFLQRQQSRITDQLNTSYNLINTIMNLGQKDYENSLATYNANFDKAYKTISLIQDTVKMNYDIYSSERDFAYKEEQDLKNTALANAQVYVNLLTSGNIDLNSISGEQQLQLNKLEIQSGLPMGFFSSIKKDPKANIVSTTSNNGQVQVLMANPDGTMSLQTYGTPNANSTSKNFQQGSDNYQEAIVEFSVAMKNAQEKNGYIQPQKFREGAKQWVKAGFSADDFYKEFSPYIDPTQPQNYNPSAKNVSSSSSDELVQRLLGN